MKYGDHITRNRGAIRFLALALGIPQALIGLWALLAPRSFYDDFPAGGDGWVAALGPFDAHLVTDVGALFVALGFLMCFAAASLRRGTVIAASVAWLLFAVPHFLWHSFNLGPYDTPDTVGNAVSTGWLVAGGALLLWLVLRPATRPATAAAPAAGTAAGQDGIRIPVVSDAKAGPLARMAFRQSRREVGKVMDPIRVYAHHTTLMLGYGAFETATGRADRVEPELKKLVAAKAAALAGCEFCIDIASGLAGEAGVPEAKLRALPTYADSPELDELERLALDLTVGMTRTPVAVSDELVARLREHLDEAQLVELVHEIALENYRARFNWAFGIGSQDFAAGSYCVRPEAVPA
ncbi:MAG: carboxymuconolactone decarboxylase family protein [Solirubrobacterales bacterium]|nr:carboxymuconolactone decarboxylase family protein [Solirubrobacterales bacterium]